MVRSLVALLLATLLAGCAGASTGSRDWAGGGSPGGGIRWGGPYGGGPYAGRGYDGPGGGYWRGQDYGYRRPWVERDHDGGRTFRPSGNVVCDRATETCYRGREIDASETREYFGQRAARRVDRIRDDAGTNRIFRPEDDVVCNRRQRVCLEDGRPSRSETREFFGKKAARRLQQARPKAG
jgi:hypothetical protein